MGHVHTKRSLPLVTLPDPHQVVGIVKIKFGEEWAAILDSDFVELMIVNARAEGAVFLTKKNPGSGRRRRGMSDA